MVKSNKRKRRLAQKRIHKHKSAMANSKPKVAVAVAGSSKVAMARPAAVVDDTDKSGGFDLGSFNGQK